MVNMNQLRRVFEDVAREFFPKWNYQNVSVRMKPNLPSKGRYVRKRKVIYIRPQTRPN
jgi:hypothetical protein